MIEALGSIQLATSRRGLARVGWTLSLAAVFLLAAGCGGKASKKVVGKVMLDGKPVKSGFVTFVGAGNERKIAAINSEGRYEVVDPPVGPVRIAVRNSPENGSGRSGSPAAASQQVPQRYEMYNNGLTFTVQEGEQSFDIELES